MEEIFNKSKMETESNNSSFSQDMFEDNDENEIEDSARGAQFSELKKHTKICSNWRESRVFVQHQDWSKPYPSHTIDIWDNHHVRLPWSNFNEFPKDGKIVKRYLCLLRMGHYYSQEYIHKHKYVSRYLQTYSFRK